jgi:hypothetical protein
LLVVNDLDFIDLNIDNVEENKNAKVGVRRVTKLKENLIMKILSQSSSPSTRNI